MEGLLCMHAQWEDSNQDHLPDCFLSVLRKCWVPKKSKGVVQTPLNEIVVFVVMLLLIDWLSGGSDLWLLLDFSVPNGNFSFSFSSPRTYSDMKRIIFLALLRPTSHPVPDFFFLIAQVRYSLP